MKVKVEQLNEEQYVAKRACEECGISVDVVMDNNRIPGVRCECGSMMDVVEQDE